MARRPVALAVLIIATLLIGVLVILPLPGVTVERIELSLLPSGFESRDLRVEVPLRSRDTALSPAQVEKDVTLAVEGELATIPGIESLRAYSDRDGASFRLSFGPDVDLDDAYAQVYDRVERAKRHITTDIGQVRYRRWSGASMPINWLNVRFDPEVENPFAKLNNRVIPALESIDGVSDVSVWGDISYYYRVALLKDKMSLYDFSDLNSRLTGDNFDRPVGDVDFDDAKVFLVVKSRFESLDDLRNFPVTGSLALKDVADVREAASSSAAVYSYGWNEGTARFTGGRGVYLPISKTSDANTVVTGSQIRDTLDELRADPTLKGFSYYSGFDQGEEIVSQLLILLETIAIGGALAVLVLLIFLKRVRLALIIALSIPLSMMMALIVMYFMGEILSSIALMGFTIVAGMLLDNAIVVSENIYRRFDIDPNHEYAAVAGAGEVGIALTLATSTTIIVFFALAIAGGNPALIPMLKALGYPICFSLIFSVFIALAVIPYTMGHVFGATNKRGKKDPREIYYRFYRRMAALPFAGAILTIPFRMLLGRPPEVLANTKLGDWFEERRRTRIITVCLLIGGGVVLGTLAAYGVFEMMGGEEFWKPIADKFKEKESGGRGMGSRGDWGTPEIGPHPSLMAIATFIGCVALPACIVALLPRESEASAPSPWIGRLNAVYEKIVYRLTGRLAFAFSALVLLLLFFSLTTFQMMKQTRQNQGRNGQVNLRISFPKNLDAKVGDAQQSARDTEFFYQTREAIFGIPSDPSVSKEEAAELQKKAYEKYGIESGSLTISTQGLRLRLKLDTGRAEEFKDLEKAIKKAIPKMAEFKVSGGFDMSELNKVRIQLRGAEFGKLMEISEQLVERLENYPGIANVDDGDDDTGYGEAALVINRERANSYGVSPQNVAQLISFQLNGTQAPDYRNGQIVRPIRILMDAPTGREGKQRDPIFEDILNMRTFGGNGNPTVSALADSELKHLGASRPIQRIDQQTTLTISANPVGRSDEIRGAIANMLEELEVPAGYSAEIQEGFDGRRRRGRRGFGGDSENGQMIVGGLVALLLIYLVMGFLFESVVMPVVVACACLPGAIFGGMWALILTDTTFDGICFLGMIILVGVSVNNGIVLVDLILRNRKEGLETRSAVIDACSKRMRPVLLTSITTCVGLLPMAMGDARFIGSPYYPLGRTVLGGILFSTLVTLFAIPVLYMAIDGIWVWQKRAFIGFFGTKERND